MKNFYLKMAMAGILVLGIYPVVHAEDAATTAPAAAQEKKSDNAEEVKSETPKRELLFDGSETKTVDSEINADNALYMNLAKEIEFNEKERDKRHEMSYSMMEEELDKRLKELVGLKEELNKQIDNKVENNENLKLLVNLYQTISADQAAQLLKQMPLTVSSTMIRMMDPKKSAKIMAAMDARFATEISKRLIKGPVASNAPTTTTGGVQ
ncbi:hypothetical protein K1X76_05190 [bacterium]|nr:hypothetical protein [bacterium]